MGTPRTPKKLLDLRKTVPKARMADRNDDRVPTIARGTRFAPPDTLQTEHVRQLWTITVGSIIDLEIVAVQDLVQLEQAFIALEEFHNNRASIDAIREMHEGAVTAPNAIADITKLQRSMTNLSAMFTQIMSRYGMSPADRTKLEWGHLDPKAKSVNPIEQLLVDEG